MLLAGKVAVITGGGRGIGRAIALKFTGEGAAVVVAARTESEIEAVAKEIRDAGGRTLAVPADVAEEKHCERLIRAAESQFGHVGILVNNAGEYGPVKPVEEITPPEWDRVIAVHLRGGLPHRSNIPLCCEAFLLPALSSTLARTRASSFSRR